MIPAARALPQPAANRKRGNVVMRLFCPTSVSGQSLHLDPVPLASGLHRSTDLARPPRLVRFVRILLKKSFRGDERNFLELLMRFVRRDVRDPVAFQKNDHEPSYWRHGASQRRSCPKIRICEIFSVIRFSTFSTVSANRRHRTGSCLNPWIEQNARQNL
jgi:hypothetical protein